MNMKAESIPPELFRGQNEEMTGADFPAIRALIHELCGIHVHYGKPAVYQKGK